MKKILLIDDDKDFNETLKLILELEGFEVTSCGDIASCCGLLEGQEAVLLDYHLPDGLGTDLAEKIKREKEIPIYMMSSDAGAKEKSEELHLKQFFMKPFDFSELIKALSEEGR